MNEQTWATWPTRALLTLLAMLVALSVLPAASTAPAETAAAQGTAGVEEVIVVLDDGADPVAVAQEMGVAVTHIYRNVFTGFAGTLPAGALDEARASRTVQRIFPDGEVKAEVQTIPTGVRRSGVPTSGDNLNIVSPVDADIAILDTGVNAAGDLTIAGGTSCVSEVKEDKKNKKKKDRKKDKNKDKGSGSFADDNGHGTHTAGIAAAIDDTDGVVGVAPGARIWAIKVLDANGEGSFSDVICGLDFVVANQNTIDVVNLSLGGPGSDDQCNVNAIPFHQAICNVVAAGIPVVAAAGNQSQDVAGVPGDPAKGPRVPAVYEEVITVSGYADSDGARGANGPETCSQHDDDTFLNFSNFGQDVDIMAPGDCILSLSNTGALATESGTSESAPHVAGAAAHFIAQQVALTGTHPTPAETRTWLLTMASRPQSVDGVTGDPDPDLPGFREPVLWLALLPPPPP
ncbi:MAG: S8 family serine peptidase [Chloroflexia bacterium]|nr:S8 family serine peptidase [Chloroflexia bacterium]